MAASLQGLIIQPRSPDNRKIAKTDNKNYEEHDDGFLYKMLDEKDWKKYRVLSEQEEFEELSKSREIKENMYTISGKFKDGKYVTEDKSKQGLKFVAPMFGSTSRSAKAAKKAWESDLAAGLDSGSGSISLKTKGAKFQNTILELAKNSQANAEQKDHSDDDDEDFYYRKHHPTESEFENTEHPNSQLFDVVNTMKNKYEQNLFVVEKLYNEKQAMERYIQELEGDLRESVEEPRRLRDSFRRPEPNYADYPEPRSHNYRSAHPSEEEVDEVRNFKRHMRDTYGSEQPPYSEYDHRPGVHSARSDYSSSGIQQSAYEPRYGREEKEQHHHQQQRRYSSGRFSAEDLESRSTASADKRRTSTSSYRPASASASGGRPQVRSQSAPRGGRSPPRYSAAMMSSMELDRSDPCVARSSSALRRSGGGLSTQLQADADRYVQKRRMLEEKERLEQLEEKKRLQEQKERLMKASKNGRQFTEMFERQQQAEENNKARQEMQRQREREEKQHQYEEKQKQAIQKQRLLDEAIKNAPNWSQIQTLEEEKRRERVERRKQELALIMGSGAQSGLMATTPRRDSATAAPTQTYTYRARDPAEVARSMAEQKRAREHQMEEQRRLQKEKKILLEAATETTKTKSTLELRKELYDEKYRKRQEAKAEKELELKRAKEAAESRKHRQIMNMHVPIGKNTKSMELKAEKIKMDLERQKAEDRKHALLLKKKALSEKETAAVVRSLVKEREMERLGGKHEYAEVNNTDAVIAAKSAAARREYKEQLRANQRKLEEALKSRPSLLERHDKKVVGKEAAKDANKKFKDIVKSTGIAEKDDIYAKLGLDEDF